MRKHLFAFALALFVPLVAMPIPGHAVTVTAFPWLAPNYFGSPSWNQAQANAIQAMHDGLSVVGSGPSQFMVQSTATADQVVVTGFPSWMGYADPGAIFGPAYANELGNRMSFALRIDGQGTKVRIDKLSFVGTSTDPGNGLGFSWAQGSYNYGPGYVGVLAGPDGILWTADDQYITSGPNTQLVDGIIGRGSGNSYAAYCSLCTVAEQQAQLDTVALSSGAPFDFTGTYNYGNGEALGIASFHIDAPNVVPEPPSLPLFVSGLGLLALFAWRRKKAGEASCALQPA